MALLAGEEELKGVRLSHPCFALPRWDGTFRLCCICVGVVVFGCLVLVFVCCLGVVFVCLFYEFSHLRLHTKVVEFFLSWWKSTELAR